MSRLLIVFMLITPVLFWAMSEAAAAALVDCKRGQAALEKGENEVALSALSSCLEDDTLGPADRVAALNAKANALAGLGRHDRALAVYDQALALEPVGSPGQVSLLFNHGRALAALGRHRQAIADFERVAALAPNLASIHAALGDAWAALGNADAAIGGYDRALDLNPRDWRSYNNRGFAWASKGFAERALVDYDRAIEEAPDYAPAYNNRGGAHLALGQARRALEDFDQAVALAPDWIDALYNRGKTRAWFGAPAARDDLARAVALAKPVRRAQWAHGACWALALMGRAELALEFCQAALQRDPRPAYRDSHAFVLWQLEGSEAALVEARAASPNDAAARMARYPMVLAQGLLSAHGYDAGPADGVERDQTRSAAAAFARDRGLGGDGDGATLLKALLEARP